MAEPPDLSDDRTRANWLDCVMTRRHAVNCDLGPGHIHLNSDDWGELVAVIHKALRRLKPVGSLDLDEIESSVRHATEVGTRLVCLECDQVRALVARVRELETEVTEFKKLEAELDQAVRNLKEACDA